MPVLAVIEMTFQMLFAYHAYKTGRDRYWLWIIIVFPGIGCVIYFLAEFFPDLMDTAKRKQTIRRRQSIDYLENQLEHAPSVNNKKALAEAYINAGRFDAAISLYQSCLTGIHEDDPAIVEGMSCAYFFKGDYQNAKTHLLKLRVLRKAHKKDQFDILLARVYEELGEIEDALEIYAEIYRSFSGEEARCRYGLLLKKIGRADDAKLVFEDIVKSVKVTPSYYRRTQRAWIDIARNEMLSA